MSTAITPALSITEDVVHEMTLGGDPVRPRGQWMFSRLTGEIHAARITLRRLLAPLARSGAPAALETALACVLESLAERWAMDL